MTKRRYFVIFGAMRTGSNLLERTLEALGDTVCHGEAFNPSFIGGPMKVDPQGWTPATRDAEPLSFLADLLRRDDRLSGFRIFMDHTEAVLRHALTDPNCARIILSRDLLDSYISLKIARETDQWVLRYPRRRISTRVRFDPEEFADYRAAMTAYYAWMDNVMTEAGTAALRIDYADLANREAMSHVARHIGSTGEVPATAPLLRQNPGPLSQKVSNYGELCAVLGRDADDPAIDDDALGSKMPEIMAPETGLHAYAPIDGPGFAVGAAFLHWIDRAARGMAELPSGQMLDAALRGDLFPHASAVELEQRVIFTIVCDPLDRVYGLLMDEVFGPGWKHAAIRRALAERVAKVGPLPEGRGALRDPAAFPIELARATLSAFLDMIESALTGTGTVIAPPAWYTQVDQIAAYESRFRIARVIPISAVSNFIRRQCARVGAPDPSPSDIERMQTVGRLKVPDIADVANDEIRSRVRRIYAADYTALVSDFADRAAPTEPPQS